MTTLRRAELRQALFLARGAWASLASGDLPGAFRRHTLALSSLSIARIAGGPASVTATAGLSRALRDLADAIEAALRPAPAVHPSELIPCLFESLQVLQRNGVDVDDDALLERARNQAMTLAGHFRFAALG